ncbi:hypothetical protein [Amycolatopsis sp. PS_44_ISF1]|uniref:hypothetical protein n=1 Tax=Amycolatopsis sp. PS_44_ISF1 TaxID=2974917 RepID=UPI0028DF7026|nr:hypothetical protein [Amycolatopsis sp. PS_44_ISF1]MDT8911646.1 hypothetical protein [Amycolatopsis sp. PS_44_ISF1]
MLLISRVSTLIFGVGRPLHRAVVRLGRVLVRWLDGVVKVVWLAGATTLVQRRAIRLCGLAELVWTRAVGLSGAIELAIRLCGVGRRGRQYAVRLGRVGATGPGPVGGHRAEARDTGRAAGREGSGLR